MDIGVAIKKQIKSYIHSSTPKQVFFSILLIGKVTAVFRLYHSEENNCRFRVY